MAIVPNGYTSFKERKHCRTCVHFKENHKKMLLLKEFLVNSQLCTKVVPDMAISALDICDEHEPIIE